MAPDIPQDHSDISPPNCNCRPPHPGLLKQVTDSSKPNYGKWFYGCSKWTPGQSKGCRLFKWLEDHKVELSQRTPSHPDARHAGGGPSASPTFHTSRATPLARPPTTPTPAQRTHSATFESDTESDADALEALAEVEASQGSSQGSWGTPSSPLLAAPPPTTSQPNYPVISPSPTARPATSNQFDELARIVEVLRAESERKDRVIRAKESAIEDLREQLKEGGRRGLAQHNAPHLPLPQTAPRRAKTGQRRCQSKLQQAGCGFHKWLDIHIHELKQRRSKTPTSPSQPGSRLVGGGPSPPSSFHTSRPNPLARPSAIPIPAQGSYCPSVDCEAESDPEMDAAALEALTEFEASQGSSQGSWQTPSSPLLYARPPATSQPNYPVITASPTARPPASAQFDELAALVETIRADSERKNRLIRARDSTIADLRKPLRKGARGVQGFVHIVGRRCDQ
ncbi:hypothetical protein BDK51DRAFT_28823 [Blyttiomyces helicus]|uniref:GRF-type domain-containing protein n=1 Tax=Blyttiomyces helicus TaxID=388810 RepID=A0A4P9W1F6_9FUNG|nr:hypothetical protein BDK51DRAFT_28823 [Blyttiomyces helicus]|eukprot:RKO83906.1 hypothetical protein BDK51DRAFT_28823 [Blyttiomyces helicus]